MSHEGEGSPGAPLESMVAPAGETGRIEKERTPKNPLWELLPTLKRFTPEERDIIDKYVRENLQDIGALGVEKKLIMGTPNDYSVFLAQSKEDRPDITGENAAELTFTKEGRIIDRSSRQTQVFLTALVQKDSPLLKLADLKHPHSNLLDTVLRVAAMYLDNPPDNYRNSNIISLLDNPEFDGIAFGVDKLKQTIPAKNNRIFERGADKRWKRDSASEEELISYLSQPVTSDGEQRWEFYGEVLNNPDFQAYRAALLGPVEPIKRSAKETAERERALQEVKQRESKGALDNLAETMQKLFELARGQKAGERMQGGSKKGNELLEIVFNDPSAKARAEIFDWQPSGEAGEMVKGRLKYAFEILSDAQAAKDKMVARVEIYTQKEERGEDRVIMIPFRESTSTKVLRPHVGFYDGARIGKAVFDITLEGIGGIGRIAQSHEEFQEVLKQTNKKVAQILGYLEHP